MALKINQLLPNIISKAENGGVLPKSRAPVLRCSLEAGTFKSSWWHRPDEHDPDGIFKAAKKFTIAARNARRNKDSEENLPIIKPLTAAALDVLEWLCMMARLCKGKLWPSYDGMIQATGRCRQSISRALNQLEIAGLLERQRRCKRYAEEGEGGPRYVQTSNVYRLKLPSRLRKYLPRSKQQAPLSDDQLLHLELDEDNVIDMRRRERSTPLTDRLPEHLRDHVLAVEDDGLRAAMERLGIALSEREYDNHTETPINNINMELCAGRNKLPDS